MGELFFALALQAMQSRFAHIVIHPNQLKDHIVNSLRFAVDKEGLFLFLQVASSLDSLVLGETQILGQLKSAYAEAKKRGFAKKSATQIFDYCFKVSKRIRNESDMFKNVISIGHLAVEFAQKEFNDVKSKHVIIFGAGEMALLTAKHFVYHGVKNLFIANRTFKNAEWLCNKIGVGTPLELSDALNQIAKFDVCVTACSGDDLLITSQYFQDYEIKRNRPATDLSSYTQNSLFIDISVPRKIENSISKIPNLKLHNIDQLALIVEQNKESRKGSVQKAECIIAEEVEEFLEKKRKREDAQSLRHFNLWLKQVVQSEVDCFLEKKSKNKKMTSAVVARFVCKKVGAKMRHEHKIL